MAWGWRRKAEPEPDWPRNMPGPMPLQDRELGPRSWMVSVPAGGCGWEMSQVWLAGCLSLTSSCFQAALEEFDTDHDGYLLIFPGPGTVSWSLSLCPLRWAHQDLQHVRITESVMTPSPKGGQAGAVVGLPPWLPWGLSAQKVLGNGRSVAWLWQSGPGGNGGVRGSGGSFRTV